MGSETKIQWADHTFNPWRGCQKIAAGCANCYAETLSKRNPGTLGAWGPNGTRVVASEAMWREPVKWNKAAACLRTFDCANGDHADCCSQKSRPRVFCASLADVFEDWGGVCVDSHGRELFTGDGRRVWWDHHADDVPACDLELVRARLFRLIDQTPNLDWLLLTKRPENVRQMAPEVEGQGRYSPAYVSFGEIVGPDYEPTFHRENVWLGVSIACQDDADRLIPELLKCRDLCAKTFVSIEPLIGPIDLSRWIGYNPLHESNTQRRSGVRGCQDGTSSSSRGRVYLEDEVPSQKSLGRESDNNGSKDSGEGRCSVRSGVSAGQDNDGRPTSDVLGSSSCVAALQRTDSDRNADKPQGRRQDEQCTNESRNVFAIEQHEARQQARINLTARNAEQSQQAFCDGRGGDSTSIRGRQGDASVDCGKVRDFASSSVEDSSRRSNGNGERSNSGLHLSSASCSDSRCEWQVSFVIIGGESGPNARPCDIAWIRSIVRQCRNAGVPPYVKQVGSNVCDDQDGDGGPWRCSVCHDVVWSMQHRDVGGADRGNTFCNKCHTEEDPPTSLRDPKGGDPAEWPEDIRVREVPT